MTELPSADLLIANLLIEYIGYEAFSKVVARVSPRRVSCIIQVNDDQSEFVSDSPYLHAFDALSQVHHEITEDGLAETMKNKDYNPIYTEKQDLSNGKVLLRLDYEEKMSDERKQI